MAIDARLRKGLLWGALAATLGSALLAPSEELSAPQASKHARAPSASAARSSPSVERTAVVTIPPLAKYEREPEKGLVVDLFEARLPPPAPPKPAPVAPRVPFAYMGMVEDASTVKVYLVQGEQMHEVKVGETFAGNYRLDAIGAEALTLTYLPLNAKQALATGGTK